MIDVNKEEFEYFVRRSKPLHSVISVLKNVAGVVYYATPDSSCCIAARTVNRHNGQRKYAIYV